MLSELARRRIGSLVAGKYRLHEIVGSGARSVVYRATHTWTGRTVAVKLLDRGAGSSADLARFVCEARAAAAIAHPSVVAIHDMGLDDSVDEMYLAMELVEGPTLAAHLARHARLSVRETAAILRPIMDALASAHRRGIAHRDLSPENVMLAVHADGAHRPVLLDFGLARSEEPGLPRAAPGSISGTPLCMAPEQARGEDAGPSADVWAMGVLWYRCLTGRMPFASASAPALLRAITRGTRPEIRKLAPSIPARLAAVIERALAVDPARRYQDMQAMLTETDRALRAPVARAAFARALAATGVVVIGAALMIAGARAPASAAPSKIASARGSDPRSVDELPAADEEVLHLVDIQPDALLAPAALGCPATAVDLAASTNGPTVMVH